MTPDEYLQAVLDDQTLASDSHEMQDLQRRREKVTSLLREEYGSSPDLRLGGSLAKHTLNRESYDLDLPFYFSHDDESGGESLEEIYNDVADTLSSEFQVQRKRSALRLRDPEDFDIDFHIDVVPGRYVSEDEDYAFLYQNEGGSERIQTNLDVHIEHIRDSGIVPAIRLLKLWNVRTGLGLKTFILELLVVKLLEGKESEGLSDQVTHVLEQFRDRELLSVEDPANSNNDLSWDLESKHATLKEAARSTLQVVEDQGWEAVFGKVETIDEDERAAGVSSAAAAISTGTRPWAE